MTRTVVYYAKANLTEMSDEALATRATELERTVFRLRAELEYVARNDSHNVAERQRLKGEIQEVNDELMDTEMEQHFRRENPRAVKAEQRAQREYELARTPNWLDVGAAILRGNREVRSYFPSMR